MEIIERRLDELKPYANNPRKNDSAVEAVAASIKEFGFLVPCVIKSDGEVVTGHTRIKAAKLLGMESVPCVLAEGLTDEQVKAFRLAGNKTGELSGWNFELLESELCDIDEIDMSEFGFEDAQAEAIELNDEPYEGGKVIECHCPKCGFDFEVEQ